MSQVEIKSARTLPPHQKTHSYLFIHNNSEVEGDLDKATQKVPYGQAGDANAILLGTKHDILVTSLPLEPEYLEYWSKTLHLSTPNIFTVKNFKTDLLTSVLDCKEELIAFIREKQKEGIVKQKLVMSVFVCDDRDVTLLKELRGAGLGEDLVSECNYDLLPLGDKDGFREFCSKNEITQLPGGSYSDVNELEKFINSQHKEGHTVVLKSPHGLGGLGQLRIKPPQQLDQQDKEKANNADNNTDKLKAQAENVETKKWKEVVQGWLKKEKQVEVEQFADSPESEHVVDIYIDVDEAQPHHVAVIYDQLIKTPDESSGMEYYGAKYPSQAKDAAEKIMKQVEDQVVPAFMKAGYTGPAGVDVLWNPLHFMELNMRTDAITYVKHLTDRVGKHAYEVAPGQTAFMALVNLQLADSLSELLQKHKTVFEKKDDGIFALSNPNRQRWGSFDVVAISPKGLKAAEEVMRRSLTEICGEEKATAILKRIYVPEKKKAQ